MNVAGRADAEGLRRVERAGGDQHRREAHERVEGGDELRHRRHRDPPRGHGADAAADREPAHHQRPADRAGGRRGRERGDDGDRHAGHAEQIALPRGFGIGKPAQRQNEQDAGDEIEQRDDIPAHRRTPRY